MTVKKDKTVGSSRADHKRKTRQAIIDAALRLSTNQSYSSLSLREITREAGISPNAFYGHFADLDDLWLSIIDEGGVTLRRVMRQVRQRRTVGASIVRLSVETFMDYIENNGDLFRLMIAARSGGTLEARRAVYKEMERFFSDLMQDIRMDSQQKDRPMDKIPLVAHAVTTIVFNGSMVLLDLPETNREELTESLITEVRLITLGAEAMAHGWTPVAQDENEEEPALSAVGSTASRGLK